MKKGFTLVELLATILILGIITTIAIYNIKKQTEFAKEEAIKESTKEIIKAADNYYADLGYVNFPVNGISIKNLDLKSTGFKSGKVKLINNEYVVVDLTDGKYCINGTKDNLELVKGRCAGPEYVYYAKQSQYIEHDGYEEAIPITIDDCTTEVPDSNVYIKFEVENGELKNPVACLIYHGEENCFTSSYADETDNLLDMYEYNENTWITFEEYSDDEIKTKPNDPENTYCGIYSTPYDDDEIYCGTDTNYIRLISPSDIEISTIINPNTKEWFGCWLSSYDEEVAECYYYSRVH